MIVEHLWDEKTQIGVIPGAKDITGMGKGYDKKM